ncbi:NAD kinase [Lacticaseibacillus saniviri]|uniref:NAD kinase n=1 Tax=Lacticaseibacillus saniviri JCM 17471 = DSM 24301 TaxID=1293598 RepID=A0A0R2MTA3_9LACO|nr:NAD kinase [Lacticaseibacillus saniviri]KRO16789.1 inorganic polyphosphate ATP-NAD kinase [Lacticaseibacillus saniviri JCM 17471 = DSM 24301]MCG4281771.1 NAD kinase [Lacticaseibacillus saniviri]
MRITVFNNSGEKSITTAGVLTKKLEQAGFVLDDKHPDVVVTVGGDGTLLSAFHRYADSLSHVRFIGVHTGHLGFYTDWRDFELDDLVDALKQDSGQSVSYPLLDVSLTYDDSTTAHFLALNEATLKRMNGTMRTDVYIKQNFFESFRGDGLCVSTPTGSTAYSKSIGGAVMHPRLDALQVTEIASINNRVFRTLSAPVIIAPDEWVTFRPASGQDFVMTVDQFSTTTPPIVEMKFRIASERIHFARYRHMHFWDRVEDAFIGVKK